jgi:hypothetical protein
MKQGFVAGCSIEVTMSLGEKTYEFVKPSYYAGVTEEWETESPTDGFGLMSEEDLMARITHYHKELRALVEKEVDVDIYDIKQVKLFQEILKAKGKKK